MYCTFGKKQADLRREEKVTYQKYLSILSLQTDYLNLDSSSGRNNKIANIIKINELFMKVPTQQTNVKKGKYKVSRKLALLVIWSDNEMNDHLTNVLNAYLQII